MEADKEHPGHPARYQEQEGDHLACPSLGARRFWYSGTVNEHTVSHGAVSFSPHPLSRAVTASFPSRASITASATFGHSASPDTVTYWHIMALQ